MNQYRSAFLIRGTTSVAAVLCACIGSGAQAAWVTDVSATADSRYDDNIRLSTDGEESAVATTVGGELQVRNVTETSELAALVGAKYLMYTGYDGQEDLDNEDIEYGEIRARTRMERMQWGINGAVRRDVLLRTVGTILDPLDAPSSGGTPPVEGIDGAPIGEGAGADVDPGSVQEQVRRIRTQASPYGSYELSEKTSVTLGYNYLGLDYDKEAETGLDDSTTQSVTLDLSNRVTERDRARVGIGAARFDPDNNESTDAYQASVGWDRDFSDRVRAGFDVGAQQSERDDDSDTGYLLRLRVTRTTDVGSWQGRYAHSLQPAGYGALVESDTLELRYAIDLSSRLNLNITGRGYRTRNTSNDDVSNDNNERDYVDVGPELTYALFESIRVGAYYRYRWIDRETEGSGSSNAVGITLSYQPQRRI